MKQITKQLMMTLALLLTAATGAWATVYSGPVSRESLQVDDILVKGAKVTSETTLCGLSAGSYRQDGSIFNFLSIVQGYFPVIGDDGLLDFSSFNITPYDVDNDRNGNAWKVVETGNQEYGVLLAGTTYVAPTEWDLTPDETGKVWTLAKMPAGKVMLLAELYAVTGLAWKQDGAKLDEGATVNYCVGFPLNLPTLENPHDLAVTYVSTDQTVATIDGEGVIEIKGVAGETTIKAKFDGDDTYEDKTVTYKLAVTQPLNLTVNQTDHGTVTVEGLDGGISITAEDKGKVICTDGSIFATAEQARNSGKSPVAMIVGIDNNKGLAIGIYDLDNGTSNFNWTDANDDCNGLNQNCPVTDGTWSLPSVAQWKTMFKAFGDNEFRNNGLNMALVYAGGYLLLSPDDTEGVRYWSTENENNEDKADYVILTLSEGSNITYNFTDKSEYCYARPILTFDLATANVIATETTGEYIVIPGTSVNLKAEADEGYNVAGWKNGTTAVSEGVTYDDYLDEENSRMPATSTLVLPLSANATISAQFTENEYNVTFLAQNKFNIKGGGAKVLVDNTDKTDDLDHNSDGSESKLGVKYGKTVKISTNEGYKLRKVEAKKKEAAETKIMVGDVLLNYAVGDTWSAIVQKNPGVISISDNSIMHGNKTLIKGNDVVSPNEPYYPNANYHWEGLW